MSSPQFQYIKVGETLTGAVDFTNALSTSGTDELLTGTPVVTASPSGLTISTPQVSTQIEDILQRQVAIGKAVLFKVAGAVLGTTYTFTVTVSTDAGNVLVDHPKLLCEE